MPARRAGWVGGRRGSVELSSSRKAGGGGSVGEARRRVGKRRVLLLVAVGFTRGKGGAGGGRAVEDKASAGRKTGKP